MNLILPFYITYIARQLHRSPLESVVAKQNYFVLLSSIDDFTSVRVIGFPSLLHFAMVSLATFISFNAFAS